MCVLDPNAALGLKYAFLNLLESHHIYTFSWHCLSSYLQMWVCLQWTISPITLHPIVFSAKIINDLSLYSSRRRGNCSATLARLSEVCNEKKDRAEWSSHRDKGPDWSFVWPNPFVLDSGMHRNNTKSQTESWHRCSSAIAWDHLAKRDSIESLTKTAVRHTWLILDQCPGGQIEDYVRRDSWEKHYDLLLPSMIFLKGNKLHEKRRGRQNDVPSHSLCQNTHEISSWGSHALSLNFNTHNWATVKARAEQNGNDGKHGAR